MKRFPGWGLALAAWVGAVGEASVQVWGALLDLPELEAEDIVQGTDGELPTAVSLDSGLFFEEIVVGPGGIPLSGEGGEVAGAGASRLIYSNTLGIDAIDFHRPNQPVSDDIATIAPDNCNLRMFRFKVLGKVTSATTCSGGSRDGLSCATDSGCPGGGTCIIQQGAFTVKYALYENCPWAMGTGSAGAQLRELIKIPGTSGEIAFPDDGPRAIKHVIDPHHPVPIPANVYLGLQFNRGNCGTVVGAPAMVGFSGDVWDFPGFPCNGYLGGFPNLPHASFWLEMYGDATCGHGFPGYKASRPSGGVAGLGAMVQGVDDIKLQVEDCLMTGYDVVVRGVGFYWFDLRRQCDGQIITGTEKTFQITAGTSPQLQVGRFTFDPPIPLLDDDLYLGFRVSSNSGGAVIAGVQPVIGESQADYYAIGFDGCAPVRPVIGVHGAVNLTITCAGSLPIGACCDMALLECTGAAEPTRCSSSADCPERTTCEAVCREQPRMNCAWPPRGYSWEPAWLEGGACEPDPFTLPCGVAACCRPDDTCEDLTRNECLDSGIDKGQLWLTGGYCSDATHCPYAACRASNGDCFYVHGSAGCDHYNCCDNVCDVDPWCCRVEWDRQCVELADEICIGSPGPDHCWHQIASRGSMTIEHNTSIQINNTFATEEVTDPSLPCMSHSAQDRGSGTLWFRVVARHESMFVSTCNNGSSLDSVIGIFGAEDHGSPQRSCESLYPMACGDSGCSSECNHSQLCVTGLTPGESYFIMLASKSPDRKGMYELSVQSPCPVSSDLPSPDCNQNYLSDHCEIVWGHEADCNRNEIPDSCEFEFGMAADCNSDGSPDECFALNQFLQGMEGDTGFGKSISMYNELLVVGSDFAIEDEPCRGSVYVFRRGEDDWFFDTRLCPDAVGESPNPQIGRALAAGPGRVAVGSVFDKVGDLDAAGSVYVYHREGDHWILETQLNASTPRRLAGFGEVVVMENNVLAVSEGLRMDNAVHLFRREESRWRHEHSIVEPTGSPYSFFGQHVALDGDVLAIGALGVDPSVIYLYEWTGGSWQLVTQIGPYNPSLRGTFALNGGTLIVHSSTNALLKFHVIERTTTGWMWHETINAPNNGRVVDMELDQHVLLASLDSAQVLSFERIGDSWLSKPTFGPCTDGSGSLSMNLPYAATASVPCGSHLPAVSIFQVGGLDCDRNLEDDICDLQAGGVDSCPKNGVLDYCEVGFSNNPDHDGGIDLRDALELQRCFRAAGGSASGCCAVFDTMPPDGKIDLKDFAAFVNAITGP